MERGKEKGITVMKSTADRSSRYILIVDDDEMIRTSVREFLKRIDYIPTVASDASEALKILQKRSFDLVISDIIMPGMDGIQFMQEAKRSFPHLNFIIMTGHASDYTYVNIIDAGAADYMTKPFEMKELRARLARIERERRILKELQNEVNERKLAEESLKEANGYIENIITSMADSLIVIKPDLTINLMNRATCELLGYAEDELLGEPIDKIFHKGISFEKTLLKELMEKGFVSDYEMSYRTRDGEKIQVSFLGSVMYKEGNDINTPIGAICLAHDMRAINELQDQVSQSEKMASIGILAAGVAHEIKNPLAIILQGIEFLKFSLSSKTDNASLKDSVERIKNATLRADKIVKDLLDFSRQTSFTLEELDASSVIEETILLVGHQLSLKGIRIIRQFLHGLPKIIADSNQIKQVFINILVNAVEAMPDGGTITISLQLYDSRPEEKYLQIAFADTGCGIPQDEIQKVFEPFFSTKSKTGSTGLGLSVTRGIIVKLGGAIKIKNEPGKGAKVIVLLPYIS